MSRVRDPSRTAGDGRRDEPDERHDGADGGSHADGGRGVDNDPAARAWRQMRALVLDHDRRREASRAVGLSFTRVKALLALEEGARSMSDLAGALDIDGPYATVVANDLAGRGLVDRQVDPDDRRARRVALTPAGRQAAVRARAVLETPPPALQTIDPARVERLANLLAELLAEV